MVSAESGLIGPRGKSWIRQLANITHIFEKTNIIRYRGKHLQEVWDADFDIASPNPIDWRHTEQPVWLSASETALQRLQ